MENTGGLFKQGFKQLLNVFGESITIYRNYGKATEVSTSHIGMKNNEKGDTKNVMFQFPEQIDVKVGDIIKQNGSRDAWEVHEVEDDIIGGTFVNLNAWVHKVGESRSPSPSKAISINIGGNNYGGIQQAGNESRQSLILSDSPISKALLEIIRELDNIDDLDVSDKEDIQHELKRVEELSRKENTPDNTERIKKRLEVVQNMIEVSSKAATLLPQVKALWNMVAGS